MARNQVTVPCTADTWTQLTNADASSITFAVLSGDVYIRFTADTTTPTEDHGLIYQAGERQLTTAITSLTVLAGADRVWAKPISDGISKSDTAAVYVDHA